VAITRGIVFGALVAVVSVALIALALIAVMRASQELLELALPERRAVWASYFVVGSAFILIGALLMRARHSNPKDPS
jgi:ABC-type Na+ efflux pump permease subunit